MANVPRSALDEFLQVIVDTVATVVGLTSGRQPLAGLPLEPEKNAMFAWVSQAY
jgi:hypothetical protein